MLINMRKLGGKWVLGIFSGVIIASFAVFGIGDVVRGIADRSAGAVVEVGDVEIFAPEIRREFNRRMSRLQPLFDNRLDSAQARDLGLVDQALNALVTRRLYDLEAARIGLDISEETLRERISESAAFHNQRGRFDPGIFMSFLASRRLSEEAYLAILRDELKRAQLAEGTVAALKVPDFMVDLLYRHEQERRIGDYMVIDNSSITGLAEPTETELADYRRAHAQRFTAPEYRRLTYLHITPEDLLDGTAVSNAELEAEYDDRRSEFMRPERRRLEQIIATDAAQARAVRAALATGRDFTEVAVAMTAVDAAAAALGDVTADALPEDISAVVFALAVGEISAPTVSPFGWHIFRVTAITEAVSPPLDGLRERLVQEISQRRAVDALYDFANRLDDKLAAGATIEEAAGDLSLKVFTVETVDRRGRNAADKHLEALPAGDEFLATAFATATGETSLLGEAEDGGEFVLRVDAVIAPALRPLEELRDTLRTALMAESRDKAAAARAAQAAARINAGADFAAVAAELGLEIVHGAALRRDGDGAGEVLSGGLVAALFAMDSEAAAGNAAAGAIRDGGGYAVIRLIETIAAEPRDDADGIEAQRVALQQAVAGDLIEQYRGYLETRFPVRINRGALDAMF